MTDTAEDILEDLSYAWSSAEAETFHTYLRVKDYESAKQMLTDEALSLEEVALVMDYFKEKFSEKKVITELKPSEFDGISEDERILVSYGGSIFTTCVRDEKTHKKSAENSFYDNNGKSVKLSEATQIWKINAA